MKLPEILKQKRDAILERWFRLILETYPPDTSYFLRKQKDRFANPVGHTISRGVEALYDELVNGTGAVQVSPILDPIIRMRAVQDFSPAEAVGFVFSLKKAIREELKGEVRGGAISDDLSKLECRIDDMALLAFDVYMKCREKIYEIKANEVKNRTFMLLERAGLVCEIPEAEEDSAGDNDDGST